jgi:hypothetical protein
MSVKVNFTADNAIGLVFGSGPFALYDENDNLWYPGIYWLAVKLPNTIQYGDVFRVYGETGLSTRSLALARANEILYDEMSQSVTDNTLKQFSAGILPTDGVLTGIKSITFDITNEDPPGVGQIKWNPDEGVLEFGAIGGVVRIQVGQEMAFRFRNNTGSTIPNGASVFISGAIGNRATIALTDIDNPPDDRSIGIATEEILDNEDGHVTFIGRVHGLDTSAFSEGNFLYADTTPGTYTNVLPAIGKRKIFVGIVEIVSPSNGQIIVTPRNLLFPGELSGVPITITGSRSNPEGALRTILSQLDTAGFFDDQTTP